MKKERHGSLDFLKIICTILILFMHYQQIMEVRFPVGVNFFNGNFNWGNVVELFFVLSGFVMFSKAEQISEGKDRGFTDFILDRLRRFAPMLALTAICYELIGLVLVKLYGDVSDLASISPWGIVQDTLCLSDWGMPNGPVNSPTWYISVLMFCYVLMYFTARLCGKYRKNPMVVYFALVIFGVGINAKQLDLPFMQSSMGRGYYAFFTGLILAGLFEKYEMHSPVQIIFSFIIFALTAFGLVFDSLSMTFLLYPALIIVFTTKTADRLFSAKLWNTLGKIQFHAYVWHAVILQGMKLLGYMGFRPEYADRRMMLAFALLTELWATFSYFVIGKRADKLFSKILPKRKSAPVKIK